MKNIQIVDFKLFKLPKEMVKPGSHLSQSVSPHPRYVWLFDVQQSYADLLCTIFGIQFHSFTFESVENVLFPTEK